ncbi:4-hydroxybenzoate polyprenyltransferase [Marchantia polymorpha subsp. ruderalis]|uniref:4-hydroxybenzoate polyprenyltransferase, mitochondrial n=2 Tax=Marchantia polymorpha TaxID=3197 RepID=A0AAF6B4N8_MARPO|nr:hypothetical protein MARPO_0100s0056 [Marchantia polymorpha]BBN06972.1 hypothetical protein Mp_3g25430 [Marchantia polymorpha subsp. ruderalis]|eukprot:PTQ32350.1 hypothetical protein MARPO_0100s0056 [Marchantia polymorpha]
MALRTTLRRTSANARRQIWHPSLQIARNRFWCTDETSSHEVLRSFATAEPHFSKPDVFGFPSLTKSLKGPDAEFKSSYRGFNIEHYINLLHGGYNSFSKSDSQLCPNEVPFSSSPVFISSGYAAQPSSSLASKGCFDRLHFSIAVDSSGSEPEKEFDQDEQDKIVPVRSARLKETDWIQILLPKKLHPFAHLARLDRPIGTWLLAWPCFWSICLAAPAGSFPDLKLMSLFGLGAILLRGAGCTVNDLLDSDIDGKVERTRDRPLASGALTTYQGVGFLGCQLLLGLGVLLQLNDFSRILGASSLLLVGTYPLMKRWTFWPQAFLGLTFNWGALLGWAAVHGGLDPSVILPLYASGISWTLVYDTIYAHQDKEDDLKVGVLSTALRFGDSTKTWLAGFSAVCVSGLALAGFNADLGWPFYAGVIASAGHLAWQVSSVDIHSRADCNSKFVSNKWFGAIVCSAIVAGKLVTQ